jgi:hypothetical protein
LKKILILLVIIISGCSTIRGTKNNDVDKPLKGESDIAFIQSTTTIDSVQLIDEYVIGESDAIAIDDSNFVWVINKNHHRIHKTSGPNFSSTRKKSRWIRSTKSQSYWKYESKDVLDSLFHIPNHPDWEDYETTNDTIRYDLAHDAWHDIYNYNDWLFYKVNFIGDISFGFGHWTTDYPGYLSKPSGIVLLDSVVIVSEYGNNRLSLYDRNLDFIGLIGTVHDTTILDTTGQITTYSELGISPADSISMNVDLLSPRDIAVHVVDDTTGFIYVINRFDITKIDMKTGWFIEKLNTQINNGSAIATDSTGNIWYADRDYIVRKIDQNGNLLMEIGTPGTNQGQFRWVGSIDIDEEERVWVMSGGRIQVFDTNGLFIGQIGSAWTSGTGIPEFYGSGMTVLDKYENEKWLLVGDDVHNRLKIYKVLLTSG